MGESNSFAPLQGQDCTETRSEIRSGATLYPSNENALNQSLWIFRHQDKLMGSWPGIGRRYPEEDREEGLQTLETQQIRVLSISFDASCSILVTFIGLRLGTLLRSLQFRDWCPHSLSKDGLGSRLTAYGLHMFYRNGDS